MRAELRIGLMAAILSAAGCLDEEAVVTPVEASSPDDDGVARAMGRAPLVVIARPGAVTMETDVVEVDGRPEERDVWVADVSVERTLAGPPPAGSLRVRSRENSGRDRLVEGRATALSLYPLADGAFRVDHCFWVRDDGRVRGLDRTVDALAAEVARAR